MRQAPPNYLMGLLMDIEGTLINIYKEFPLLTDKDVEWCYDQLREYFKKSAKTSHVEEPLSQSERKQALIDEVLNLLDQREETGADDVVINNPAIHPTGEPIPSLAMLYVMAFKYLRRSVRFWRKEAGARGYLEYIKQMIGE